MGVAPQDDVGQEHRARAHGDGGINIGGAGIQQTDAVLHQPGIQIGAGQLLGLHQVEGVPERQSQRQTVLVLGGKGLDLTEHLHTAVFGQLRRVQAADAGVGGGVGGDGIVVAQHLRGLGADPDRSVDGDDLALLLGGEGADRFVRVGRIQQAELAPLGEARGGLLGQIGTGENQKPLDTGVLKCTHQPDGGGGEQQRLQHERSRIVALGTAVNGNNSTG